MAYRAVVRSTGVPLLNRVEVALTGWERLRGLMLRREIETAEGLLIPECSCVHTCFMRFPIDVVYLSPDNVVVKIVHRMKPWDISACAGAQAVLEMLGGWADKMGLALGDVIVLEQRNEAGGRGKSEVRSLKSEG